MAINSRSVTATVYRPDGSAWEGGTVSYILRRDSYTALGTVPRGIVTATTDENGACSAELWTNADGLVPSHYDYILPDGATDDFVLPAGATTISLEELRAINGVGTSWTANGLADAMEVYRAELADTENPALGDALIGMRNTGTGAIARTVHDKLNEYLSVTDFGAVGDGTTDDRDGIQAAIDAAIEGPITTVYFPPGDYVVKSGTGASRTRTSLLAQSAVGLSLMGDGNATITIKTGVSGNQPNNRPIIFRDCTDLRVSGLTILDRRTTRAGSALCFENSSQVTADDNIIDGFGSYGIVVSEDTSTYSYQASTISFSGHRISDTAAGLSGIVVTDRVFVYNTVNNNGFVNVTGISGDGSYFDVSETLVTEAAGASGEVLIDNSISFDGSTLFIINGSFAYLDEGDRIAITGSTSNNGTYTISDINPDGLSLTVAETFITEAAGADITVTGVGKPLLNVWSATACDDVTIRGNRISNCGRIGVEIFPKELSRNLIISDNTITDCGTVITSGCGLKPGQAYVNSLVSNNNIIGCQMGINIGLYHTQTIRGNNIINCHKYGIAISNVTHPKYPEAPHDSLIIDGNLIAFTSDGNTEGHPLFQTVYTNSSAININGNIANLGPVEIKNNTVYKWGSGVLGYGTGGIAINKSHMSYTNFHVHHNLLVDSGGFTVDTIDFWAGFTNGSAVLTNLVNQVNDRAGTSGWYKNLEIAGAGIPDGTSVVSVNAAGRTLTLSNPVTTSTFTFTATTTSASAVLDTLRTGNAFWRVQDWHVGAAVSGTGIQANTTVTSVDQTANTLTLNKTATATATGITITITPIALAVRSGRPAALHLTDNKFISTTDTTNSIVKVHSDNAHIERNTIVGFAAYAMQIAGSTAWIVENHFIDCNRDQDASRGPILVGLVGEPGIFHVYGNMVDLGPNGAYEFLVNSAAATTLYMRDNQTNSQAIVAIGSGGIAATPIVYLDGGRRVTSGTTAPTTGTWTAGDECRNEAPTPQRDIHLWRCVTSGTPGTWRAVGVGTGTTTTQTNLNPAMGTNDSGFQYYNTSTSKMQYWTGTAWINVTP
jgi:hypothetical protein